METFGQYLKRERTLRQINLKEISAATRIHIRILKQIEADDYTDLPAPAFLKGFLKAYAKYLGLKPEDVILRFQAHIGKINPEENQVVKKTTPQRKKPLKLKLAIAGTTLLILGAIFFLFPFKSTDTDLDATKPAESVMMNVDTTHQWYPLDGNKHYLRAHKDTWIKIKIDDMGLVSFPMAKDTYKTFFAKKQILIFTSTPAFVSLSDEKERFEPLSHEQKAQRFIIKVTQR